jgi:hypothetical protein
MYDITLQKKTSSPSNLNAGLTGIVKALISAFRNYSLYPEDHALSIQCIRHVTSELIKYTENTGDLALKVEKDGLYSDSKKFYSCLGDDDPFVGPLVRDGILSLEFKQGIQPDEITAFFQILKKNRSLPDDPDSDTVTDLWQAELAHLVYEVSDVFWDAEPVFTFPNPTTGFPEPMPPGQKSGPEGENKRADGAFEPGPGGLSYEASFFKPANLDSPHLAGTDLSFNPDELGELRTLVADEEKHRREDEILDLLLLILDEITTADDLENVLVNLADEFLRILKNGDAYKAFSIIEKIQAYQNKHGWMRPFVEPKVERFMSHLAGPGIKVALPGIVDILNRNRPEDVFFFKKIGMALSPTLALSLCETLVYLESQSSRDVLMDIIKAKTREEPSVIEVMVGSNDKMMVLIGISLLKGLKDASSDVLLQRLLNHPVEQVRSSALDYFLEKPVSILPRIFFMINDQSMDIKIKLLRFIGARRAVSSETLMMNYLSEASANTMDKEHLLSCYKILGKCGSDRCLAFLKKRIFGGAWIGMLGNKAFDHRSGALLALSELESAEAMSLLNKASKSKSPLVSRAYKLFME